MGPALAHAYVMSTRGNGRWSQELVTLIQTLFRTMEIRFLKAKHRGAVANIFKDMLGFKLWLNYFCLWVDDVGGERQQHNCWHFSHGEVGSKFRLL